MKIKSPLIIFAIAATSSLCGGVAQATTSWSATGADLYNSTTATATAYADNGGSGKLATATKGLYSGVNLGISYAGESTTSPQHAMDNNGFTESLLLNFSSYGKATLNSISIGWISGDADVSILAYTGSTPLVDNPGSLVGKTYAGLLSSGWTIVSNEGNLAVGTARSFNGSSPVSSSYWLVSAYNSAFSSKGCNGGTCGGGNDYFKISALGGTITPPHKVPEPAPMALIGISMLGMLVLRRSKK